MSIDVTEERNIIEVVNLSNPSIDVSNNISQIQIENNNNSVNVNQNNSSIQVSESNNSVDIIESIKRVTVASNVLTVNGAEVDIIDLKKKVRYNNYYFDPIYTDEILTGCDVFTDATKTTQLFSHDLTYDVNGILESIIITDIISGKTLSGNFGGFNANGTLKPFTKTYA